MIATPQLAQQTLAAMELFRGLPPSTLAGVAACARVRRLPKDLRIFSQGDDGVRAHAVIEGGVRIAQSGGDGAQVIIRFIGPGEMFGTVSLFTDGRYPADAITLAETLEASWSEAELLDLIHRHPQIGVNVIRIIGRRLQEVQERVRELATQRAERRVAHAVLRLARQAGHSTIDGTGDRVPITAQGCGRHRRHDAPHGEPHPHRLGKGGVPRDTQSASDDPPALGDIADHGGCVRLTRS
jgi:CRP-like cAMP-binding protein